MDSNASDRNAKRHKCFRAMNVDGQFIFEIQNESSKIEGLGEIHYGDKGAIMGDDEQELDEGDPNSDNDHEEAPNNLDIRTRQLSIGTTSRPRQSHRVRRTTNATTDGNDSST